MRVKFNEFNKLNQKFFINYSIKEHLCLFVILFAEIENLR
jgi:hypothetical protein